MPDPITLTDAEVQDVALDIYRHPKSVPHLDGNEIRPEQLTEESRKAVNGRLAQLKADDEDLQATQQAKLDANNAAMQAAVVGEQGKMMYAGESDSTTEDGRTVYPGSVVHPEGYTFVGAFTTDDETGIFELKDTQPIVEIEEDNNVSVNVEGHFKGESGDATLRVRLIHDGAARVYLFRKDEDDTTFIKSLLGHG